MWVAGAAKGFANRLGCSRTDMSSVRLHKASVVGHHNHLVAVNGNLDRMLEPRIEHIKHKVLLTVCFDDLRKQTSCQHM